MKKPIKRTGWYLLWLCGALMGTAQAAHKGDPTVGREEAGQCTTCHGADYHGSGTAPALAGKSAAYIATQLRAFRSGARQDPMMGSVAKGLLSDEEVDDLAAYLSTLP
jgi:cytochrome c553